MVYCIDTSALIFLKSEYSYDVFPPLWDELIINLVSEKRLFASFEVKEDLEKIDDDLIKWIKKNCNQMFVPTTTEIMKRVKEIQNRFKNLVDPYKPSKNLSDPFVIAIALESVKIIPMAKSINDVLVITYEKKSGDLKGPKMPDICQAYGLRVGRLIDMFKFENYVMGQ